jgi:RNA polymerase sigma-70 factor (ECF subfamily)
LAVSAESAYDCLPEALKLFDNQAMILGGGVRTSESDETLAARHLDGDPQAFRELMQRYTTPIYNLAWRLTRDQMEAENITQDTFLRALNALPRVSLDQPLKPWLFKIAVNLCRQWAERKKPQLFSDFDEGGDTGIEAVPDGATPPLERLEENELRERIRAEVDRLPSLDQTVITLRYVEALTYEQIAQALDLPLNTVRTRLRRAKQKLRAALGAGVM